MNAISHLITIILIQLQVSIHSFQTVFTVETINQDIMLDSYRINNIRKDGLGFHIITFG